MHAQVHAAQAHREDGHQAGEGDVGAPRPGEGVAAQGIGQETVEGHRYGGVAAGEGEGLLEIERTARKSGHLCPYGGTEVSMAGSYSADLRGRVLAAVE